MSVMQQTKHMHARSACWIAYAGYLLIKVTVSAKFDCACQSLSHVRLKMIILLNIMQLDMQHADINLDQKKMTLCRASWL